MSKSKAIVPQTQARTNSRPRLGLLIVLLINLVSWLWFIVFRNPSAAHESTPPSPSLFHAPTEPSVPIKNPWKVPDRLSHIYVKLASDHYYGTLPIPSQMVEPLARIRITNQTRIEAFKDGVVIYCDSFYADQFVTDVLPRIKSRFVLVTGDSNLCMPKCRLTYWGTRAIVQNPNLIYWWTSHCEGTNIGMGKIGCMPLGIDQHGTARFSMQKVYEEGFGLVRGVEQRIVPWDERPERYLLVSFQISTNRTVRGPLHDLLCGGGSNVTIPDKIQALRQVSNCFYQKDMKKQMFYKNVLAPSRFVVAPAGAGPDSYRVYEALLLGSYPIVKTSSLDVVFKDLPVLIVQDWTDLTVERLERAYRDFQSRHFDFRTLYTDYWRQKFRSHLG
ncbi:hypothetical protein BC830DRAFT_230478 [Chytriomyces sp. MP71]|nr:hypothetical protein BC830DRAFT_230478 [Chytriomyces sp. MP71]